MYAIIKLPNKGGRNNDAGKIKVLCYENEYNDGKYHMLWLDKNDVSCEDEYETLEELIDAYNDLYYDNAWNFTWIDKEGHEFYPWAK